MYNRNPNDVANERTDVPETYEQDQKRLAEYEAALRRTEDPVSGTPPPTDEVQPVAHGGEDREAR
ncbi:MAG TPA: hypothetical protein VFU17_15735 [Candidatus Limnocylindrales bacterium]|nr:hypothetical protein [Candidatus Limnocylindrales bacterium]